MDSSVAKMKLAKAESDSEIARCYPVMRELRTHIVTLDEFMVRVRRQAEQGYWLAYAEADGEVRAVAGNRYLDNLFSGRILYVDDLVTREMDRSHGYGDALMDWLVEQARQERCVALELDSGVQRHAAHRFYLRKRMDISSYHFRLNL